MSLFQATVKHHDHLALLTADTWSAREFYPVIPPVVRRLVPDAVTLDDADADAAVIINPSTLREVRLEASSTTLAVHYSDGDTESIDLPLRDQSRLFLLSGLSLRIAAHLTLPKGA